MISGNTSTFSSLDINGDLNVDGSITLNGTSITPSSITGASTVSNTDGSITITNNDNNFVLSNAGSKLASDMNANENNITNVNEILFSNVGVNIISVYENDGILAYNQTGQATGNVYDDKYNFPYISTILSKNDNCNNNDITGLNDITASGNLNVSKYVNIGNAINNSSQLHLYYGDGTQNGDNIQLVGSSAGLACQYYHNDTFTKNMFSCDNSGNFTTSNINVSTINNVAYPPSSTGSSVYNFFFNNYQLITTPINATINSPAIITFSVPLPALQNCKLFKLNIINLVLTTTTTNGNSTPLAFSFSLFLGTGEGQMFNNQNGNSITGLYTANTTGAITNINTQNLWTVSDSATNQIYLCFQVESPSNCTINMSSAQIDGFIECFENLQFFSSS